MRSLIACLPAALLIAGCDRQSAPAPQANETATKAEPEAAGTLDISQRGSAMPTVAFEAPDGKRVTLAKFKGEPLLVNLWATWCGPCVAEMPTLDALAERHAGKLQVLVVSQDINREKVDGWWARKSFKQLEKYLDTKSDLGFAFGTGMVPTTVLYDTQGKEVWRVIGGMDWDGPRANTLLAETVES